MADKFSGFLLNVKCTTVEDGDGCIFKSSGQGGIGFIRDGSETRTYRWNDDDFNLVFINDAHINW